MRKAVVTIVGRPNVGKSTLFNRIIQRREAIVDDLAGVTRDRKFAEADWSGVRFTLIDTGGYFPGIDDRIGQEVLKQVETSIGEADVVVFVTDARAGLTALDHEIAQILKRFSKPMVLAINKADTAAEDLHLNEFYRLGFDAPCPISAESGRNVGDLLDLILDAMPAELNKPGELEDSDSPLLQLAVVGKPNVGKSSFINALLGKEQLIVTDIPGTTRDAIDTRLRFQGEELVLVDTAGLRRRSKVDDHIEYFSTVRTHDAIRRCDVAVVMVDAVEGLTDQDIRIVLEVVRFNKGIVLAINKWDLVEKDANTAREFEQEVRHKLQNLSFMPVLFISALQRQRIFKVLEVAKSVYEQRKAKLATSVLNRFLRAIVEKYPPPSQDRKEVKINYMTQVKAAPPVFALFANHPESIRSNYRQYIENQFRRQFPFTGVPLTFVFKKK